MVWSLQVLKDKGMGQDLTFSSLKCCCHICSLWVWHEVFLTQTLSGRHGCSVWESPVEHYTHRESASSFSFCVSVRECKCERLFFFVYDLYSLLPASIKSDPTTRRAAMHNTLVLYLSSYMLSGLDWVKWWWYDNVIPLQTCCDIVLVLSACSGWTLIKWWYRILLCDLLYPLCPAV